MTDQPPPSSPSSPQPDPSAGSRDIQPVINALRARIDAIVREGRDVRGEVSRAVADASVTLREGREEMARVSSAVMDAAVTAASESTDAPEGTGTLREVIDGLGDGFSTTAQAAQLAIQEARAKGRQFADDDLRKVAREFGSLGQLIVDTLEQAIKGVGGHLAGQADGLREHASRTLERVRPSLESAAGAATDAPKAFVKEAGEAGASAAQQAAGTLFTELGAFLQKAGERLRDGSAGVSVPIEEREEEPPPPPANLGR